jgi:DNA-binding response OmpR family regulator
MHAMEDYLVDKINLWLFSHVSRVYFFRNRNRMRQMNRSVAMSSRVLLVEDEALVSLLIEEALTDLGYTVVGPATSVEVSLAILATEPVDVALIDVSLGRELGLPIADALADKGIPFAFVTGYGPEIIRGTRHAEVPLLLKPFSFAALATLVVQLAGETAAFAEVSVRDRQLV